MSSHGGTEFGLGLEQREGGLQVVLYYGLQDLEVLLTVAKCGLTALQGVPRALYQVLCYLLQLLASLSSYKLSFLQKETHSWNGSDYITIKPFRLRTQ